MLCLELDKFCGAIDEVDDPRFYRRFCSTNSCRNCISSDSGVRLALQVAAAACQLAYGGDVGTELRLM